MNNGKPYQIETIVQNEKIKFEIHTDSPIFLNSSNGSKIYYSGDPSIPCGIMTVEVRNGQDKSCVLELFILPGESAPIECKEWLSQLNIANEFKEENVKIKKLENSPRETLERISRENNEIFAEELGT